MSFSLIYIVQRACYRAWMFIYDWYAGGLRVIGGKTIHVLESLDRTWALVITLRNIAKPLYGDASILGSILGFIFRSGRVITAACIYAVVIIAGGVIYVAWAAIPAYIVYKGFVNQSHGGA